jgi:plasmid stabilization system protein ParE
MNYQLYLQTASINDLRKAFDWYEAQKNGLGHEFLSEAGAALDAIEKNPFLFQEVYRQKRKATLRRFPYNIIYAIEGNIIRVSAVMHSKQAPRRWQKRK